MAKFVIHIGDGKCGSSSLQASLYNSRELLRSDGIVYETATPSSGQFSLAMLLGQEDRGNQEKSLEQAHRTLKMIQAACQPDDTVLLSAESFFSIEPIRLIELLQANFGAIDKVFIIAYVREPHDMYLSLVQQQLKGDSRFVQPDRYVRDIYKVLKNWESCKSVDSLTVRLFSRAHLVDGDVVADFEHELRRMTGKPNIRLPRENRNTTMSAEQMIVLQEYRKTFLKERDGKLHPESNAVIRYFELMNKSGLPGTKPALSAAALSKVQQANKQIISNIRAHFPSVQFHAPGDVAGGELPKLSADTGGLFQEGAPAQRISKPLPQQPNIFHSSFMRAYNWIKAFFTSGRRLEEDEGSVQSVLRHWDPKIVALLQSLVITQPPKPGHVSGAIAKLRRFANRNGLDPAPLVAETTRFWNEMRSIKAPPAPLATDALSKTVGGKTQV